MQTLAGAYWAVGKFSYRAQQHVVTLDDGDRLALHDDQPDAWQPGDKVALLIHGLAGCHLSGYMQRIAARLVNEGVRVYRLDMRGCGASFALAQHLPHSGRIEDVAAALAWITQACPGSPVTLVGFSLGGNLALNFAAERRQLLPGTLAQVVAVCPPIDLVRCSRQVERGTSRVYGRFFVRLLLEHLARRQRERPELPAIALPRPPRTLWEFDHHVTAPLCGFSGAEEYYQRTSPAPRLKQIDVPTLIIAASDDPLVPHAPFTQYERSSAVQLLTTSSGGHLGFLAAANGDADCRWLDWRLVEWIAH